MPNIGVEDVNAWVDGSKLAFTTLDSALEAAQAAEVFARLSNVYATSGWTGPTTTPSLVKKIIAMLYVGWFYQKQYSEDEDANSYGLLLIGQAERLMAGLEDGTLELIGAEISTTGSSAGSPVFYPTDVSSAQAPTYDDPSLGGPRFTMGTIW